MGKGLPRSHANTDIHGSVISKTTVRVDDVAMTVDGAAGVGWGTAVLAGLPEGNILFLGAVAYIEAAAGGTVDVNWAGDYGVGTTPATDATLTTGDVDIVESTDIGPAGAGVSPNTRGVSAAGSVIFDNTDGSLELNFNLLIDDADISADAEPVTVNGTVTMSYVMMGDD